LEVVEAGISTVEQEFLNAIVLPNGSTVGEWIGPQVGGVYARGEMPALMPGGPRGDFPGRAGSTMRVMETASLALAVSHAAAGGPSWTDVLTAVGTVGSVIAAVFIALWTERRSGKRINAEHARADQLLAQERAHGRAQLEEERRLAREREQEPEAYAVQIVLGERPAAGSA
jgi:hypothetical protein